jgi:small subunit ribosomal protein S21
MAPLGEVAPESDPRPRAAFTNANFRVKRPAFPASLVLNERSGWDTVQVVVRDNNVEQALRALKKKMQREGVFREMKLRRNYEKPSERRAREKAEAVRRYRKLMRKRMDREGY